MLAGALAVVVALPGVASADAATFRDAHRDVLASNDVHRVRVVNGADGGTRVRVAVTLRNLRFGDRVQVWLDTDASDRGPEFRVWGTADSDDLGVRAVERWHGTGREVACPRLRVRMSNDDPQERARFLVPRPCLDGPGAVRVSVHSRRVTENGAQNDWAPALRRWYAWVAR